MPKVTELDGLRAIAVGIVFLSHFGLGQLVPGGLGVTIFFFLSGYLITSLLRAEYSQAGRISLSGFYARRTLRIMPPLYITMLFCAGLLLIGLLNKRIDAGSVVAQALFYSNYDRLWGPHLGFPMPLWSLAVEEHFYLLFPLIYSVFIVRLPPARAMTLLSGVCVLILVIRLLPLWISPNLLYLNYYMTHTRIDSIIFGCILATYNNPVFDDVPRPRFLSFAVGSCLVLIAALARGEIFAETFRYSVEGIGLWLVFSYVLRRPNWLSHILNSYPLQKIGLYSYTIYLVHLPLKVALLRMGGGKFFLFISGVTLTMIYAAIMHRWVEAPLARFRKKLHEERAPVPIGADEETS